MSEEQMRKKSIKELEEIHENYFSKLDQHFAQITYILLSKYQENHLKEKIKNFEVEYNVSKIESEGITKNRFPKLKESSIRQFFSKEKIDYLKERVEKTTNPILRAKYADIIYELDKREIEYAVIAIKSYLNSSNIFLEKKLNSEFCDSMERAISIAIFIKNSDLMEKSYQTHMDKLQLLYDDRRNVPFKCILSSLINRRKKLKGIKMDLVFFERMIEEVIAREFIPCETTFSLHRFLLELLLSFDYIKKDPKKSKGIRIRIANTYEWQGDYIGRTRSEGLAAYFYEDSLKIHNSIGGRRKKIESLQNRIRKSVEYNGSW